MISCSIINYYLFSLLFFSTFSKQYNAMQCYKFVNAPARSVKNKFKSEVRAVAVWVGISRNDGIMGFKAVFETVK